MGNLTVVEICAGAGGQALGLEHARFKHELAIELDPAAAATLRANRRDWHVITGDVAEPAVWEAAHDKQLALPGEFDLLAGGVPCPPFSIAGKQLGANDERDLFAWAVEQCDVLKPKALLLENVRGLSMPRFSGYRQHILDRLGEFGYVAEWRLLHASDFGVPQLRPRFVLVALKDEYAAYFRWPEPQGKAPTVGQTLKSLMGARNWKGAAEWADGANDIAPTIVGGSKKHGGADLGPTRAKRAWEQLGVDAMGVADEPPGPDDEYRVGPKLTTEMVSLLQGWNSAWKWNFEGKKTSRYRQIGNAFPPPVAEAVGRSIRAALLKQGKPSERTIDTAHDPIYRVLRAADDYLTASQISRAIGVSLEPHELERRISLLSRDFDVAVRNGSSTTAYKIGQFKAFIGQEDHVRHDLFLQNRAKIS
jgi:DNA (cytosine-5)-methyltransferase 1